MSEVGSRTIAHAEEESITQLEEQLWRAPCPAGRCSAVSLCSAGPCHTAASKVQRSTFHPVGQQPYLGGGGTGQAGVCTDRRKVWGPLLPCCAELRMSAYSEELLTRACATPDHRSLFLWSGRAGGPAGGGGGAHRVWAQRPSGGVHHFLLGNALLQASTTDEPPCRHYCARSVRNLHAGRHHKW